MTIWFFMDSIRWTPERITAVNRPGLGGSVGGTEAMTVGLCKHFAARGHDVTLWVTKCEAPGTYGQLSSHDCGVKWRKVEGDLRRALLSEPSPDVFVAVRQPQVFSLPEAQGIPSHRVLWAGDVLEKQQGYLPFLTNVDTIVYVSEWQRQQWQSVCPSLATQSFYSWVTPVALDASWIALPDERARDTFIYASQPDRGLVPLLKMWPRIRAALPNATLLVTGYTAELSRIMILADRLIQQVNKEVGGVVPARAEDKPSYFRHLSKARLLLYPGAYFEETNGHVCSEAMATGVIPLVSRLGALGETVPESAGILFDGDANDSAYQEVYIAEVIRLASPSADAEVTARQKAGYAHVIPRCTYQSILDLWEGKFRDLPVQKVVV